MTGWHGRGPDESRGHTVPWAGRAVSADRLLRRRLRVKLPAELASAGLIQVSRSALLPIVRGGRTSADCHRLSLHHMRDRFLAAGLLTYGELAQVLVAFDDPELVTLAPAMVIAWGGGRCHDRYQLRERQTGHGLLPQASIQRDNNSAASDWEIRESVDRLADSLPSCCWVGEAHLGNAGCSHASGGRGPKQRNGGVPCAPHRHEEGGNDSHRPLDRRIWPGLGRRRR